MIGQKFQELLNQWRVFQDIWPKKILEPHRGNWLTVSELLMITFKSWGMGLKQEKYGSVWVSVVPLDCKVHLNRT